MPLKIIQFRGGTVVEHELFVGHDREITVNTTNNRTESTMVQHPAATSWQRSRTFLPIQTSWKTTSTDQAET